MKKAIKERKEKLKETRQLTRRTTRRSSLTITMIRRYSSYFLILLSYKPLPPEPDPLLNEDVFMTQ
jgi:hypothetical protein